MSNSRKWTNTLFPKNWSLQYHVWMHPLEILKKQSLAKVRIDEDKLSCVLNNCGSLAVIWDIFRDSCLLGLVQRIVNFEKNYNFFRLCTVVAIWSVSFRRFVNFPTKLNFWWILRVMINCSKFVCSKKLIDTIFHLLDTIQANVTFLSTGRKSKIICRTCISSSCIFRQKKILTARIATGRQRFCKMSTARHNL